MPVSNGLVIGRGLGCDVVLDDEKASRRHARMIVAGGVAEIEDLGSRNGVRLNGNRVSRRMVRDGDVLVIGTSELTYREEAKPAAAEPEAPASDLEIIEFVDEVVTVRKREDVVGARPAAAGRRAGAPGSVVHADHGVLRSGQRLESRGLLGDDVSQLGGLPKLGLILIGLACAAGLGWLAMVLASG